MFPSAGTKRGRRPGGAILVATCLGLMVSMFNSTLVNVVMPAVGKSFDASSTQLQWIATVYTLCYAALLLPGGALGNRLGRRKVFLGGLIIFAVGSALCAAAPVFVMLLAGRVVQAVGAAVMLPHSAPPRCRRRDTAALTRLPRPT